MVSRLPRDTHGQGEGLPRCPWCWEDTSDAVVTLEDLACAHDHRRLARPERSPDGAPDPVGLVATSTCCGRPILVALQDNGVRLLAVRTEADLRLLGVEAA